MINNDYFILGCWTDLDVNVLNNYLNSIGNPEKVEWTKNIVCTNKPVFAIKATEIKELSKMIARGNWESYLDCKNFASHEACLIYGNLLNRVREISLLKKYLKAYAETADNWAVCDALSLKVTDKNYLEIMIWQKIIYPQVRNFQKESVLESYLSL